MVLITWPRLPPCPYMIKTLKNLLLWNQKADDLENWYAASDTRVLPSLFKCMNMWWFMTTQGQDHSSTFVQGHLDSTFSNFFSSKNTRPFEARFHMEPPWDGMKNCANVPGHITKVASRPMVNLLLRNQEADDLEAWYAASGTQVLPNLFKWPWQSLWHGQTFLLLLHGWKLMQQIVKYFQACSNSAYHMRSGER